MPARVLQVDSGQVPAADPPEPLAVDSDVVVILAALLCALICVVGLAMVARCAWMRRSSGGGGDRSGPPPAAANKGLKKKVIRSLPKVAYGGGVGKRAECPICLAEFEEGEEVRVLPQCGHQFHVGCVDTWLGAHSSCPSCRRLLVVAAAQPPKKCRRCGASSSSSAAAAAEEEEGRAKAREDGGGDSFLP